MSPRVTRVLDAARAPGTPRELAREETEVARFHRVRLAAATPRRDDMQTTRSARAGLKAMVASAGAVVLMSTGVAFAASGHAPWSSAGSPSQAGDHTHAADDPSTGETEGPESAPTDGTDATMSPNEHAFPGLCRAYASGNKTEHGKALESPAFVALVTAAGGADQVTAYCASLVPQHPQGSHPTHPAKPTHPASPSHPTGAPSHPTGAPTTHPASPTHPVSPSHPTGAPNTHPAGSPHHA
jgi:hypothetical protein